MIKNSFLSRNSLVTITTFFLFLVALFDPIYAQDSESYSVTGVITDSKGLPLPGVNVVEKNTTNGAQTDFDGNYTIKVSDSESVLIFSYVGMKTAEIPVKGERQIDVQMAEDAQSLDEVVLVGYGTQKKISVVGAQSTIKAEELQLPVANLGTMLAGRISGLTGVQRSGLPGFDGADLWIRGISTFGNNRPLILVDGVERSLDNVNPIDIESFSILKDASATAVYGVRGANGVILIQTKRGKIGKPSVSLDYFEGITYFTKTPELVDGVTYMNLANEALTTRGQVPRFSQEYIDRTASNEDPLLYPNVNWLDEVFNDFGRNRQALVNVRGGAQDAQYYVSLAYYDETGLFVTDGVEDYDSDTRFKRYNFTSNTTIDITKTTNVNVGIQGYLSEGNYPGQDVGAIFGSALEVSPVEYPKIYPGGYVPGKSANGGLRNPYAEVALRGYRTLTRTQLNTNLNINQELSFITEGLSLRGLFSFDSYNEQNTSRSKRESTYFVDPNFPYTENGELLLNETFNSSDNFLGYSNNNGGNRQFYMQMSLNYERKFGEHSVSGLLLANREDFVNAFAGDVIGSIPFRNQGLAMRATYSYDDKYFLEFNAGYNGSENFAPSERYGYFPALAFGWIVSNEPFFEPLKETINYLKLRYSHGIVGSDSGANRFAYLNNVSAGQSGYNFGYNRRFTGGIAQTAYAVDVTWVESTKKDLGIEINAFDNRLRIIYDIFTERTKGSFLRRADIPNYIGLTTDPFGNIGEMENKGFDGSIEYRQPINDLTLNFRGTFTYNDNKILENGVPEQPYPWLERRGTTLLANVGYVAERLFSLEDDVNGDGFITPEDGFPTQFGRIQPGDIKYQDLNDDGQIDDFDRKVIGKGDVPALTYGFGLTAKYKNFDLSLFFQGQNSAERFVGGQGIQPFIGDGGEGNVYKAALDRWTPENDNIYATTPRLSFGSSSDGQTNNTQLSTWWLRDIDFLRLKTAEVGFTLPSKITDKINIVSFRLYARATNLFTIGNFDLWDPELNTNNGSRYPNISVVSIGGTFNF
ncbi:TonB-dependent receptor [Flavivirga sp. 57AJ16]|uniref:SusC/RagA family TonB-linked outer membrane protein n=1 Tax=Flavivirga sp. 57AJ16 TaxID=3025307 RepID=UPI0023669CE9|nr:TonB-dependent receptor [Flavivirga sp. 57AJ16]MDD7887543.1 TonB-dependent receptor [Flavivirga sp. 57AJ16]